MSRRQRGVVLTDRGKQRLEAAIASAQDQEKYGARFTQSELETRAGLSIKTIKKILDQLVPIDEASVRTLFEAFEDFGLELEPADYGQPKRATLPASSESTARKQPSNAKIDWGEKPDTALFFGRAEELATLNQWVQGDQCRLITLLGMGGIGKTSLAAKLANQVYDRFDYVIWRSLREAPPLDEILVRLIQFLSDQQETEFNLPTRLGERIIRLLHYLREHRCLVVLDNLESILQAETAGHYRDGYEGYGELIQHIGSTEHQSCLLLTSRECPRELAPMAGDLTPVRLWSVGSIDTEAGREILKTKGLALDEADDQGQELIRRCSGNPQALHLVATAIQREFLGDVDDFLQEQVTAVEDVRSLLDQHLSRLAPLERSVLFWLAINREPVGLDELMADLLPPVTKQEVRGALRGLSDRYLIETVSKQFTLQNVIMEFSIDRFIKKICLELLTQKLDLFNTHAFTKATAREYVRKTQTRLILKPIAERIITLDQKKSKLIEIIREHSDWSNGYAAGNLFKLLWQSQAIEENNDFSKVILRQVALMDTQVHEVNFTNASFIKSSFSQTFGNIWSIAFNPSEKILAIGTGNGNIYLWDIECSHVIKVLKKHTGAIRSIAFSPDGNILASGSDDKVINIWEGANYKHLRSLHGHTNWVHSISFSFSGNILASGGGEGLVRLWDLESGHCFQVLKGHTSRVRSVAFHPKENILASGGGEAVVRLWCLREKSCTHILQGHSGRINTLAFSPSGEKLATSSDDFTVRLWDIKTSQCIRILQHSSGVTSLAFNPHKNIIVTGSRDLLLRVWDVRSFQCLNVLQGHFGNISSVTFSPSGKNLASAGGDQSICFWDLKKGLCQYKFSGYSRSISSICFSPNGDILAGAGSFSGTYLWSAKDCQFRSLYRHDASVRSLAFAPNCKTLATACNDGSIQFWDVEKSRRIQVVQAHTSATTAISFSFDGAFFASGDSDGIAKLWNALDSRCLYTFPRGGDSMITATAFNHNDSILAISSADKSIGVCLWHIKDCQFMQSFKMSHSGVRSMAFSPDDQYIATAIGKTIVFWDIKTGQLSQSLKGHTDRILSVSYSPDGNILASGSFEGDIRLWNANIYTSLLDSQTLKGHSGAITSLAFSPDNKVLASGSKDGTIRLWDVWTGNCLSVIEVPRPYEGTNITGVSGITQVQRASLLEMGAFDSSLEE